MSSKIIDTNKEYKYGFTTDIEDISFFCNEVKEYIVLSQKISFPQSIAECASIGGNVVAPESAEENKKMIQIMLK